MRKLSTSSRCLLVILSTAALVACNSMPVLLEPGTVTSIENYPPVPEPTQIPEPVAVTSDADKAHADGVIVDIPANLADTAMSDTTVKPSEKKKN